MGLKDSQMLQSVWNLICALNRHAGVSCVMLGGSRRKKISHIHSDFDILVVLQVCLCCCALCVRLLHTFFYSLTVLSLLAASSDVVLFIFVIFVFQSHRSLLATSWNRLRLVPQLAPPMTLASKSSFQLYCAIRMCAVASATCE